MSEEANTVAQSTETAANEVPTETEKQTVPEQAETVSEKVETPKPESDPEPKKVETDKKPEQSEKHVVDTDYLQAKEKELSELNKNYTSEKAKAERLETAVKSILDSKLTAIPEEYKDLVPDVDDLAKLDWISKAEAKGLFAKKENPEIEIGKSLKVDKKEDRRTEPVTPQQRLADYFSTAFKK